MNCSLNLVISPLDRGDYLKSPYNLAHIIFYAIIEKYIVYLKKKCIFAYEFSAYVFLLICTNSVDYDCALG